MKDDEAIVWEFTTQLRRDHGVDDAIYAKRWRNSANNGIIDLVAVNGYYDVVSMTLNVARVKPPAEAEIPFKQAASNSSPDHRARRRCRARRASKVTLHEERNPAQRVRDELRRASIAGLWTHPRDRTADYNRLPYWLDLARTLERGRFDGLFLADVLGVYDVSETARTRRCAMPRRPRSTIRCW